MNLKSQLKFYLDQQKMSVLALSKQTGVANATLADWMKGKKPRDMDQVMAVAKYFKTTIDNLVYGEGFDDEEKTLDLDDIIGDRWLSGTFEVRLRRVKKKA